jgi:Arc/MetJ family transcription regulator
MRTTVTLDENLISKALKSTGPLDRSALIQESLKALIERESAKRLALLGGSQKKLKVAPRRRQETA